MKTKLVFFLKYYLFWIGLSVVAKIIFLLYQWKDSQTLTAGDVWHIIFGGLHLDLSLGGYIMMVSGIFLALSSFLGQKTVRILFSILTILCLTFFSVVTIGNLELFKNWGFHVDTTPLMYLKTPKEMFASTPIWLVISLFLFTAAFGFSAWYVFKHWILSGLRYKGRQYWCIPLFLLIGGAMLIPVRGGFNVAPMNSSFVFFHPQNMYANQAAINPVWNFVYELTHMDDGKKKYDFMSQKEAERIIKQTKQQEEGAARLLKTERPNIVFLLLESFTASAIEVLGGLPDVTPNLNALAKEGILFSNIYATGNRSDRGMVAAISALPSNPSMALIDYPNRLMKYPRFPKDLESEGYTTQYYYAGDINFGNFRSYVTMSFQNMIYEDHFSGEAIENRFKWGVHDQYMFERLYEDIEKAPQPFMYMAFNMSSHEPFTVPGKVKFPGNDQESMFANAIHYSDSCIGNFILKCKESKIWDNTLFILMADHGTRTINHLDPNQPAAYHIPLLLTGGVLNVQDSVVRKIGSQTDMIATVLNQLGMDHSGYKYSRDLLAPSTMPFAFYSYPNAAALISEQGISIMNLQSNQFIQGDTLEENKTLLKAYLQSITSELGRN